MLFCVQLLVTWMQWGLSVHLQQKVHHVSAERSVGGVHCSHSWLPSEISHARQLLRCCCNQEPWSRKLVLQAAMQSREDSQAANKLSDQTAHDEGAAAAQRMARLSLLQQQKRALPQLTTSWLLIYLLDVTCYITLAAKRALAQVEGSTVLHSES